MGRLQHSMERVLGKRTNSMLDKLRHCLDWTQRIVALIDLVKLLFALGLGATVRPLLATRIPSVWLTPIWLLSSAVILWLLTLLTRFVGAKPKSSDQESKPCKEQIYIGPDGMPIQLLNEKVTVNLRFFACVTAATRTREAEDRQARCCYGKAIRRRTSRIEIKSSLQKKPRVTTQRRRLTGIKNRYRAGTGNRKILWKSRSAIYISGNPIAGIGRIQEIEKARFEVGPHVNSMGGLLCQRTTPIAIITGKHHKSQKNLRPTMPTFRLTTRMILR
jgi:hypothetical protein